MTLEDISSQIPKLPLNELFELNKSIVKTIRLKQARRSLDAAKKFAIGDSVTWESRKLFGKKITGTIIRCNAKTATIEVSNSRPWSVSWELLTKVQ